MIADSNDSIATIEEIPSNICTHEFTVRTHKLSFKAVVIKMKKSIFIWIGNPGESSSFSNLSFAAMSSYQSMPLHTSILALDNEELCNRLAIGLSKKLAKPVYVSVNLMIDHVNEPELEKLIRDEITAHPENFK